MSPVKRAHWFLIAIGLNLSSAHASTFSAPVFIYGDNTLSNCSQSGSAPVICQYVGVSPNPSVRVRSTATSTIRKTHRFAVHGEAPNVAYLETFIHFTGETAGYLENLQPLTESVNASSHVHLTMLAQPDLGAIGDFTIDDQNFNPLVAGALPNAYGTMDGTPELAAILLLVSALVFGGLHCCLSLRQKRVVPTVSEAVKVAFLDQWTVTPSFRDGRVVSRSQTRSAPER